MLQPEAVGVMLGLIQQIPVVVLQMLEVHQPRVLIRILAQEQRVLLNHLTEVVIPTTEEVIAVRLRQQEVQGRTHVQQLRAVLLTHALPHAAIHLLIVPRVEVTQRQAEVVLRKVEATRRQEAARLLGRIQHHHQVVVGVRPLARRHPEVLLRVLREDRDDGF